MRKAARKAAEAAALQGEKREVPRRAKRDESQYHKGSCDMRPIDEPDEADWKPGDFWFREASVYERIGHDRGKKHTYPALWACFPDRSVIHIPLEPMPEGFPQQPSWKWDGNRDRPTLTPSVHIIGHWHGWVRAGRMVSV